MRLIVKL